MPSTTTAANVTTVSAALTAALLSAHPLWIRLVGMASRDATALDVEHATTQRASAHATLDMLERSARLRPTVNKSFVAYKRGHHG